MLGRKDYTQEELDQGRLVVKEQLVAYRDLPTVMPDEAGPEQEAFERRLFNNMTVVLDRFYVHRFRMVAGKDGNPLNEVELIVESLMNNKGVLRGNKVVKYVADDSVLKLAVGDEIRVSADDFERLAAAFLDELERRFVRPA